MSATNRGAIRRERDAYFTPQLLAEAICVALRREGVIPGRVFEPSAGAGAFMDAAILTWPMAVVRGMDIRPTRDDIWMGDFLTSLLIDGWSLVIGNPPFRDAEAFVRRALGWAASDGHVAFLLRAGFLHGAKRAEWVQQHLRWYMPLAQRPSFTDDGKTDASEYSVFVWQRGYAGTPQILPALRWRP